MKTLCNLSPGQSARVMAIQASTAIRQRMFHMGILPNAQIALERVGPTGHPLWIACQGSQIALRLGEAEAVLIIDDVREAEAEAERASATTDLDSRGDQR
ncbi:MAG: ferrous iron transport protein A [Myxococcales bacterium]|jgi:Fe2+ transport system protein FeoA|nr:ferrous iron transport protein A [Myxococcales bacterium]